MPVVPTPVTSGAEVVAAGVAVFAEVPVVEMSHSVALVVMPIGVSQGIVVVSVAMEVAVENAAVATVGLVGNEPVVTALEVVDAGAAEDVRLLPEASTRPEYGGAAV